MGLVYAEIDLSNAGDVYNFRKGLIPESEVKKVTVNALVDSGAINLCINETVQNQLSLPVIMAIQRQIYGRFLTILGWFARAPTP